MPQDIISDGWRWLSHQAIPMLCILRRRKYTFAPSPNLISQRRPRQLVGKDRIYSGILATPTLLQQYNSQLPHTICFQLNRPPPRSLHCFFGSLGLVKLEMVKGNHPLSPTNIFTTRRAVNFRMNSVPSLHIHPSPSPSSPNFFATTRSTVVSSSDGLYWSEPSAGVIHPPPAIYAVARHPTQSFWLTGQLDRGGIIYSGSGSTFSNVGTYSAFAVVWHAEDASRAIIGTAYNRIWHNSCDMIRKNECFHEVTEPFGDSYRTEGAQYMTVLENDGRRPRRRLYHWP